MRTLVLAGAVLLGGCLRRADFVPPPMPEPLRSPPAADAGRVPDGPLTPADAVRIAFARNPDLAAAIARGAQAAAVRAGTGAAFLPRVSADVGFLHGDAPSAYLFKRIDARRLPARVDFNDPGSFENLEGGVGLQWNLWNGGRDVLARWSADAGADAARLGRDAAANTLAAMVLQTCFDVRAAGELLAADDAAVRTVEVQVAESRVKVEGGGALRADLLSLEVRLAEARQQRFHTETVQRLAQVALRDLLALPVDAPLVVADGRYAASLLPASVAEAVAEAYRFRPEAAAARRNVERAQLDLAAARRAYLPRLDLVSRLYADVPDALHISTRDPNYTVAVALSIDLFDGGARGAAIRRAGAVLDEITAGDQAALQGIARDVESAWLRLSEARARSSVASQAVGAAEESLELVAVQFRGGGAPVTRYLEAESARAHARTARIRAELDVERATVDVERALGRLTATPTQEGGGA